MGSVKRKSAEESSDCAPPQKLQREDDDDSTQIINEELVGCVHDVSFPENYVPPAPSSSNGDNKPPAKEFPFALDSFQSEAIKCLDNGESVMVSSIIDLKIQTLKVLVS